VGYIVAVDTGGTFTDCVIVDEQGRFTRAKSNSTPQDFSIGVIDVLETAAQQIDLTIHELLENTMVFSHGTTVATNAFVTGKVSKTGLITTKGAEDTLLIGRGGFQKTAGLTQSEIGDSARLDKPSPLVARQLIRGVSERVDRNGEIIVPLNEAAAIEAIQGLLGEGVEAISVCLLWSFKNPVHEKKLKSLIQEISPQVIVTISCELIPVIGEYQRTVTTIVNALLNRTTSKYLRNLQSKLEVHGLKTHPLIMQSAGGVVSFQRALNESVSLLSSGPSGGLIGCLVSGREKGYEKILSADVGGTSFDVGIIVAGKLQYHREPIVGRYHLKSPMLEVESIGAGGGSIAWIEPGTNHLKVGPMSAGADPGPACYDRGGDEPTVTDADIVLNRLNPDYFLGGRLRLNKENSINVIRNKIAGPMATTVEEAAISIIRIVDAKMADLIRKVTISRGYNPKDFVIFAFGGAGPVHAASYGKDVGASTIIVPSAASVFSALGIAASDFLRTKEISSPMILSGDRCHEIGQIYEYLEREILDELASEEAQKEGISLERSVDLRYCGQVHEICVPVAPEVIMRGAIDQIGKDFEFIYEQTYGQGTAFREAEIEAVIFRVIGRGHIPKPSLVRFSLEGRDCKKAFKERRNVYWDEYKGYELTDIYEMDRLRTGNCLEGPAIIEGIDTTVVVHPRQTLAMDEFRDLILRI
jgi:N-methylhydantoinase A